MSTCPHKPLYDRKLLRSAEVSYELHSWLVDLGTVKGKQSLEPDGMPPAVGLTGDCSEAKTANRMCFRAAWWSLGFGRVIRVACSNMQHAHAILHRQIWCLARPTHGQIKARRAIRRDQIRKAFVDLLNAIFSKHAALVSSWWQARSTSVLRGTHKFALVMRPGHYMAYSRFVLSD